MRSLYQNPIRVYLLLGLVALFGVISGFQLPISLFPNSSKPLIYAEVPYGSLSADDFFRTYGKDIESQLQAMIVDGRPVEKLEAEYAKGRVSYKAEFPWNVDGPKALSDVRTLMAGLSASWPEESRANYRVDTWNENSGFLAVSFYSTKRSLTELYDYLDPLFIPLGSLTSEASEVNLYNPNRKIISVVIDPEKLASLQVTLSAVEESVRAGGVSLSGGRLKMGENRLDVEMPRLAQDLESIKNLPIYSTQGRGLLLRDVADVQLTTDTDASRIFKTSGVASLILFAQPKPGGNIKKMSETLLTAVEKIALNLPKDIQYKVLVNPAEFINSSVRSVIKEVVLAAIIAVAILLVFIGSFKNVITAAIEIPISIIMAFIFMRLFDMNLNLISLGGLALSAGMNVDASVVVMENIFRKFDEFRGELSPTKRLQVIMDAVDEVKMPVIASTIASLVVFAPLVMTDGLTQSILGDLAKAVIFSHSMSAVVALVLVPTVRLQMMKTETNFHLQSPIEKQFRWLEDVYAKSLESLIRSRWLTGLFFGGVVAVLAVLLLFVLPKLRVEVIGRPETDWLVLGFNSQTFTSQRQVDTFAEKLDFDLQELLGDKINYTFTNIQGYRQGQVMIRLKNRKDMEGVWRFLEEKFVNTPTVNYFSVPWNPSELPIPDPDHFRVEIRGGSLEERKRVTQALNIDLRESQIFPRVRVLPDSSHKEHITFTPYYEVLRNLDRKTNPHEIANFVRVATSGKKLNDLTIDGKTFDVKLSMPEERFNSLESIKSLPFHTGDRIVPLNALMSIEMKIQPPERYRVNQSDISIISARVNEIDTAQAPEKTKAGAEFLARWLKEKPSTSVLVEAVPADQEIRSALSQLKWALLFSVLLIFVTMVLQFGDVISALLVLVAIPLGFIGVILSLSVFQSTLSLNSALGTILLSGIAVANSIILVDFMRKLVAEGRSPIHAAVEASRARLRPILMTSLTTVLGMMPIALGQGEGGRILQPLGIAVAGGLWISMLLTLFAVPALQTFYLNRKNRKSGITQNVQWSAPHAEL